MTSSLEKLITRCRIVSFARIVYCVEEKKNDEYPECHQSELRIEVSGIGVQWKMCHRLCVTYLFLLHKKCVCLRILFVGTHASNPNQLFTHNE